ncbi:MAG: thioredoxin [Firmicutes bacterium]|nr:thioredoxin [Bacillota bacterium]
MSKPIEINEQQFQEKVLDSREPVLVDFWADWCGPCRMVAPVLEEIAGDYGEKIKVVKVNVDESPATASRYGVMSIPTMILFKNGELLSTIVGFRQKEELKKIIDSNI